MTSAFALKTQFIRFALLAPLVAAAFPATARDMQHVEVRGNKLPAAHARQDVSRVCPAIHQQLPEALASAYNHWGRDAVVQVQVRLQGERIVEVLPMGGLRSYHRHVRSAMGAVDCRGDGSADQVFAFAVRFGVPAAGQQAVALIESGSR